MIIVKILSRQKAKRPAAVEVILDRKPVLVLREGMASEISVPAGAKTIWFRETSSHKTSNKIKLGAVNLSDDTNVVFECNLPVILTFGELRASFFYQDNKALVNNTDATKADNADMKQLNHPDTLESEAQTELYNNVPVKPAVSQVSTPPMRNTPPAPAIDKQPFYKKTWFITSAVIIGFLLIVGIGSFFHKNNRKNVLDNIFASTSDVLQSKSNNNEENEDEYIDGNVRKGLSDSDMMSPVNPLIETLTNLGYTYDHAADIEKILRTLGIENIEIYGSDGSNNDPENGLYNVVCFPNGYTDDNRRFYFTTENGVVFYAGFRGEDLYDSEKGGFLKSYSDVHVPETKLDENTKVMLRDKSETVLDRYFKYTPYYDAWAVGREDDNYATQCQAYAKNGFGQKDWVYAKVWYHYENGEFVVTAVSIDGVQYEVD